MQYVLIVERAVQILVGLMQALGMTQKVSDIIAGQISAGRSEWTDEERAAIRQEVEDSKAYAEAEYAKRVAADGGQP